MRDGEVLACRNDAAGYYYLPGGHVEFGESAASALVREFVEECGLEVEVGALRIVTEGKFESRGKNHHELNLVFHVKHPISGPVKSKEPGISFHWLGIPSLLEVDLRPMAIKAWLMDGGRDGAMWASEITTQEGGGSGR